MNTCNFEGCHTSPLPVTALGVTFARVKELYIFSFLLALFPGPMQCEDISIFLGLSALEDDPNSSDLQKDSLCGRVMWAYLCVTGVNQPCYYTFYMDTIPAVFQINPVFRPQNTLSPEQTFLSHIFLLFRQEDVFFSWSLECTVFWYRFSIAHTAKVKLPTNTVPLIINPEVKFIWRSEQKNSKMSLSLYNFIYSRSTFRVCWFVTPHPG